MAEFIIGMFIGLFVGFFIGTILCFNIITKLEDKYNYRIKTILERDERKNGDRKNDVTKN